MGQVDFKAIQPVPAASDFLDIVLSRTQRKTPTVIHKGYSITRIRSFYLRKVKYTQATFDEKLGAILAEFPRLDDIHPFYADLMNVLYDKDHYKLALGQINTAKHLIDNVGSEYLKLIKYGDSLFRCKQLKRAALGRMATIMKRQKETLAYLEQVRQHVSRLPSIDPNTRTLLICGYPNVGKSSFMNKLTRANVDVQPYAFTTKSLFVGHMDYSYLRWQVIDTPGILDHPLEDRNTIEMQSITALAHIRACVLYFMDLSEQCGFSIQQQVSLFASIRPLFANKPLMVVCNKADLVRIDQLRGEDLALLQGLLDSGVQFAHSSCVTEEGIMEVRNAACEKLLAVRLEHKLKSASTPRINDVLARLHVTSPAPRDTRSRLPCIPDAVLARRGADDGPVRVLARDTEAANGGAGVYNVDLAATYMLQNPAWNHDAIPEIIDGKNIADFIDADIEAKLAQLEAEEDLFESQGRYVEATETEEDRQLKADAKVLAGKRRLAIQSHREVTNNNTRHVHPERIAKTAARKRPAVDMSDSDDSAGERSGSGVQRRSRSVSVRPDRSQVRSVGPSRDRSLAGVRDADLGRVRADKHTAQRRRNLHGHIGEADRAITERLPKHLFSGKRKGGTHDRR